MLAYTTPLAGGFMIGAAAVALLLLFGRIAGISGIVFNAVFTRSENTWRWLFLAGLVLGPVLYHGISGTPHPQESPLAWWHAVMGGLLVGIGVQLGSGCTSGHGVCGIGRLSVRSVVATVIFMVTGILTVFVTRHVIQGF